MGRVMVTGSLGFIGSHLVERLVERGSSTIVFDDGSNGRTSNISSFADSPCPTILKGDIRHAEEVERMMEGVDTAVHLVATVSVIRSVEDPWSVTENSVIGTLNVQNACVKRGVKRAIFASSAAVYSAASRPPLRKEDSTNPVSPYAASRLAGEAYCHAFASSYGLEAIIVRFFNVYGRRRSPGPCSGVMVKFAESIKKKLPITVFLDGEQTRDFVHVNDVVDALFACSNNAAACNQTFNMGTGFPTRVNELAEVFARVRGVGPARIVHAEPRKSEVVHSCADITKAKSTFGYKPKVKLEEGVRQYVSCVYLSMRRLLCIQLKHCTSFKMVS
jgi:nucleoside-diphosphate-sugar epimerase